MRPKPANDQLADWCAKSVAFLVSVMPKHYMFLSYGSYLMLIKPLISPGASCASGTKPCSPETHERPQSRFQDRSLLRPMPCAHQSVEA